MYFKIKRFLLGNRDVELKSGNKFDQIIVKDGKIIDWNLLFEDKTNSIRSIGNGDLKNGFNILTNMDLRAEWIEVFSPDLKKIKGRMNTKLKLSGILTLSF